MEFNCPICNKVGLPDYRTIETICPQCNSDLKPFVLLNSISESKKEKKPPLILLGTILITIVFAFLFIKSVFDKKEILSDNLKRETKYKDSIRILQSHNEQKSILPIGQKTTKKESLIKYKIRKKDTLSKIAKFFYNDWSMYKKIEDLNNLKHPYTLKIGQILLIKIEQD